MKPNQIVVASSLFNYVSAVVFLAALSLVSTGSAAQPAAEKLDLRVDRVTIKVTDMDQALTFYRDVLGFAVLSEAPYPERVALKSEGLPLVLERARRLVPANHPEVTQTKLSLESADLLATMARLRERGVVFLQDPPQPYGRNQEGVPLGIATRFRDPFGHEYSIVEQQRHRGDAFSGIRVYNTGFYVPDVEAALAFYRDRLGFAVLTEQYYPNIPMGDAGGALAFMLHEFPEMRKADLTYPDDTQLLLVFTTQDLGASMQKLRRKGVAFLDDVPRPVAEGRVVAFRDPFGNVAELLERHAAGSR